MPVKLRKRRKKGQSPLHLTEEQEIEFISVPVRIGVSCFRSEAEKEEAWWRHREQLLATWLKEPANLGKRPEAWWQYEAPEPRRLLEGSLRPMDAGLHLGLPARYQPDKSPVTAESQPAYLARLGLLTPEEKAIQATFEAVERIL